MFVLVNLKAYACDPIAVAEAAAGMDPDRDISIAVAPQVADLSGVAETGVTAWVQHTSPAGHGSHTGSMLAVAAARNGATGTLLNHSERPMRLSALEDAIDRAKAAGLRTCVCASTPEQIGAVAHLEPDAVAIEPPELIGTGTPVSQANPDIVLNAIDAAKTVEPGIDVYCGAGISTSADIAAAADLGSDGVLLASAVATADDPAAALADLLSGLE